MNLAFSTDPYGRLMPHVIVDDDMIYPMQCLRCYSIHDAGKVTIIQRYSDCSTWRCPNCNSLIDDRPQSWGGSAVEVKVSSWT